MKKIHLFLGGFAVIFAAASSILAQDPTVKITSPAGGTHLALCSIIHIVADPQAANGVKSVMFYINGAAVSSKTKAPFEYDLKNAPDGIYELTAKVTDKSNATAFSDKVIVVVGNPESGSVIFNGEFMCSVWPWALALNGSAQARLQLDPEAWIADSTAGLVTIQNIGPNVYDVQLQQAMPIDSGHIYTISFFGASEKAKDITVAIQMASDPYTGYLYQSVSLTNQPSTFGPYTYTASETNPLTYLRFQIGGDTTRLWLDQVKVIDESKIDAVDDKESASTETGGMSCLLCRNFPNPFNSSTAFQYFLPKEAYLTLDLYNLKGQKIRSVVREQQSPGEHLVRWNGTDDSGGVLPSGVYLYYIKAKSADQSYTYSGRVLLLE
jgi:hypothetical protein